MKCRYLVGIGHQLVGTKGKVHGTFDSKDEAENARDQVIKEHEHPYWNKSK